MKKNSKHIKRTENKLIPMLQWPIGKMNFIFMAISGCIIILGFLLMLGSGSTTTEFNSDIFSTRRIVIGPTIAFIGFILMGIAIIYRPKTSNSSPKE